MSTASHVQLAEKVLLAICPTYVQVHASTNLNHLLTKMEEEMKSMNEQQKDEYAHKIREKMVKTCSEGVVQMAFGIAEAFADASGGTSMLESALRKGRKEDQQKKLEVNLGRRPRL